MSETKLKTYYFTIGGKLIARCETPYTPEYKMSQLKRHFVGQNIDWAKVKWSEDKPKKSKKNENKK